jgi:hypothetical protein
MKKTLVIAAFALVSGFSAPLAQAIHLDVEIGDRDYYVHGPGYWEGRVHYCWVPGHWGPHRNHWIHGHYRRGCD